MLRLLAVFLLAAFPAAQSAPRLLLDVNTEPVAPSSSNPDDFARFGAWVFFSADDGVHGRELFRTNGMAATTGLFADLNPGPDGSDPRDLVQVGTRLFFTADDGVHGRELWVSDGTAGGTRLVADINPGRASCEAGSLFALGAQLFVVARDGTGFAPWAIDVATATLTSLWDAATRAVWALQSAAAAITRSTGTIALFAARGPQGTELWRSDGTIGGTRSFASDPRWRPSAALELTTSASLAIVTDQGFNTWISDGTASGTWLSPLSSNARFVTAIDFDGNTWVRSRGTESCWITDGTPGGTRLVAQPAPWAAFRAWSVLGVLGSSLWFFTGDPTNSSVTRLLRVVAGSTAIVDGGSAPDLWNWNSPWPQIAGRFLGWSGTTWTSFDPLTGVTETLAPTSTRESRVRMYVAGGTAYFAIDGGPDGMELGASDGSAAGTRMVADLNRAIPPTHGSLTQGFFPFGRRTAFVVQVQPIGGAARQELWITDGTSSGTTRVASASPWITVQCEFGPWLIFTSSDAWSARAWRTDGTASGTQRIADPAGQGMTRCWSLGDRLIAIGAGVDAPTTVLSAGDGVSWTQLAEIAGTRVVDGAVRLGDSWLLRLRPLDTLAGDEIWRTDGTIAGTWRIPVGFRTWREPGLVTMGDRAWFTMRAGPSRIELWSTDGTPAGTRRDVDLRFFTAGDIEAFVATQDRLFLFTSVQVFATDGTQGGTVRLPVWPNRGQYGIGTANFVTGRNLVIDTSGPNGFVPWISDGTVQGTMPLAQADRRDLGMPRFMPIGNGKALFHAYEPGTRTMRTWICDGTSAGTHVVSLDPDLLLNAALRGTFALSNGRMLLESWSLQTGTEPFVIDLGATIERLSEGCGVGARRAELFAALGGSPNGGLTIEGRSSAGGVAQIVLSAPPMRPLAFPQNGACTLDVDPNAWVLLASLPITNQRFAQSWPLPDDPALYGLQAVVQGFVGPTNAPLGANFTNGLLLSLGQ